MLNKQFLFFALIALFVVSMSACTKKKTAEVETSPEVEVAEEPVTPPVEEVEEIVTEEPEVVKLPVLDDVFFAFDRATLTDDAKGTLTNNAKQLREVESVMITIEGHCDERGTNAYNMALGEKRANAARDYLVSLGVPMNQITTISYGEERPFDSGHTEAAWEKNRRGHFIISQ